MLRVINQQRPRFHICWLTPNSLKFVDSNLLWATFRTFSAIVLNATTTVTTLSQRRRRGLAWVDPLDEFSTDHWIPDQQRLYSWGTLPNIFVHQHVYDSGWSHAVLRSALHRTDKIHRQYADVRMSYLADVLHSGNEGKRVTLVQ